MSVNVRKASASDINLITQALLKESRDGKALGLFDLVFKTSNDSDLLEFLTQLSSSSIKSYCHYSNFFIAMKDNAIIGTICGYEPRIATHELFSKSLEEMGFDESYHERIAAYLLCQGEVDNKTWVLDFIHIDPQHKVIDTMKEIIGKCMLTARLKGYRKVQTLIEIGSVENEMIFKKLGFTLVEERRSDYYREQFGRAGIMRLQLEL